MSDRWFVKVIVRSKFISFIPSLNKTRKEMAAADVPADLASVATRAEERLTTLESAVFNEREEVKR